MDALELWMFQLKAVAFVIVIELIYHSVYVYPVLLPAFVP